ncbi:MAG: hypothetical protein ABW022_15370, partial [Actinoplanes sp.]
TDPGVWVVGGGVRFGRFEVPFSPGDLRMAPGGAAARTAAPPPAPEPAGPPPPEFVLDKPAPVRPPVKAVGGDGAGSSVSGKGGDGAGPAKPVKGGDGVTAPAPRKAASARAGKTKPPAALTVTLAYGEGEWTVAASQGSKVLAKPYVVRPAEALRMVSLVDVPGVQEAVEQILSAERAEAEQQAQRLRAELAEVEARLAELGEAG